MLNEPVTTAAYRSGSDAVTLSTTDAKGRITHVNEEFVEISGFSR